MGKGQNVFLKWGGAHFGDYPINAEIIDDEHNNNNGACTEPDNFYPWTAIDDDDRAVGHFIMRYTGGDSRQLRFGWVIVDDTLRGKGYGKQMLTLGLEYVFDILKVDRVTIGVFENNEPAYLCYKKAGFVGTEISRMSLGILVCIFSADRGIVGGCILVEIQLEG